MKRTLLFLAAVAAYFVVVLLWVGGDKRVSKEAFDDFSVANTGTNLRPLCTAKVSPSMSGMMVERRDQVLSTFFDFWR